MPKGPVEVKGSGGLETGGRDGKIVPAQGVVKTTAPPFTNGTVGQTVK